MREKLTKGAMHRIYLSAILIIVFAGGLSAGNQISSWQGEEKEYCMVDRIAVVNLDQGIEKNGKVKQYARELGALPDLNFEYAGLEEARQGLANNQYAAYILIPSDFSQSVESIHNGPQKAPIEYYLNENMKEDMAIGIFAEVISYIQQINDNLSYLYVDAVLEEFHRAQDDAGTVMQNDTKDMEALTAIQESELTVPLELPEKKYADGSIETVELTESCTQIEDTAGLILDEYDEGYHQAEKEFSILHNQSGDVDKAVEGFEECLSKIDIQKGESGKLVYQDALDEMDALTARYDTEKEEAFKGLRDTLKWDGSQEEVPDRKISLYEIVEEKEKESLKSNEVVLKEIKKIKAVLESGSTDEEEQPENGQNRFSVSENSGESESGETDTGNNGLGEAQTEKIFQALEEIESTLPEEGYLTKDVEKKISELEKQVDELPVFPIEEATEIVDTKMIGSVEQEIRAEQDNLNAQKDIVQKQMEDYAEGLTGYDPMSYMDTEEIDRLEEQLQKQIAVMENHVNDTAEANLDYAEKIEKNAEEQTEALYGSLEEVYEQTEANVTQTVSAAKRNREALNEENVELLADFTECLSYTRVGSIAHRNVYDFVVNPIEVKGSYEDALHGISERQGVYLNRIYLCLIIAEAILLAVGTAFYILRGKTIDTNET